METVLPVITLIVGLGFGVILALTWNKVTVQACVVRSIFAFALALLDLAQGNTSLAILWVFVLVLHLIGITIIQ